jgi:hypothetical protein
MTLPPLESLPKAAQKTPAIAARYATVTVKISHPSYTEYRVTRAGEDREHSVVFQPHSITCDCEYAIRKPNECCMHILAANLQHTAPKVKEEKKHMPSRFMERSETRGGGKQFIVVEEGLYVGWLQRYSQPFEAEYKGEKKTNIRWSFLLTHTAFGSAIPKITLSTKAINNKSFFFNPDNGKTSGKFDLYYALTAREFSDQLALVEAAERDLDLLPGEDDLIARPALLKIKPSIKKQLSDIQYNNIESFMRIPNELKPKLADIYKTFKIETDKDGFRFIASPEPTLLDTSSPANALPSGGYDDDAIEDEIPF